MKDLSYKNMFTGKVSHEDALKERIKSSIVNIVMEENSVSEKSFKKVDEIVKDVNEFYDEQMFSISNEMYNQDKRINYIGEFLYDKYYKKNINESVLPFNKFK